MLIHRLILKSRAKAWRKAPGASVPTICVGNITVGGTGKTPHTEMILDLLQQSDRWGANNLAVLSRGYKRKSKGYQEVKMDSSAAFAGDEPLQIKRKFPAVKVVVDKDRVEGCERLVQEGTELIVLDDAFQYKKLHADLNIVLVDYNRPIFKDKLLPFGRLRDIPEKLKDAEIVIVTKCPREMDQWEKDEWREKLKISENQTLLFTYIDYDTPKAVFPEEADSRYIYSKGMVLFTGIANNNPLASYLSDSYKILDVLTFPDHHRYGNSDMRSIAAVARRNPTAAILTTEKDAVRVLDCKKVDENVKKRLFYVPIKVNFIGESDKVVFSELISAL